MEANHAKQQRLSSGLVSPKAAKKAYSLLF